MSVTTPANGIKVFEIRDFSIIDLEPVLWTVEFDFVIRGFHSVWIGLHVRGSDQMVN